MTMLSIPLSDDQLARLGVLAEEAGLSPEEFVRQRLDALLTRPEDEFERAARRVLEKNAELYRRLA